MPIIRFWALVPVCCDFEGASTGLQEYDSVLTGVVCADAGKLSCKGRSHGRTRL